MLLSLNYSSKYSLEDCLDEARQYGRVVAKLVKARFVAWQCENEPKRLRIGIISGDLRKHSVGHFLERLLSRIDSTRIELIAYPTHYKEDALTARICPYFSSWISLVSKSDEVAARLIHADGVHALLDLSGHTGEPLAEIRLEARTSAGNVAGLFRDHGCGRNGLLFWETSGHFRTEKSITLWKRAGVCRARTGV